MLFECGIVRFFIPHLDGDHEAAEEEWLRYLRDSGAPPDSKRVYAVTYHHESSRFEVQVGEGRREYKRRTGPRGGYIKNAGLNPVPVRTGTRVSGIVDTGPVIYVWSYGPPFGGWANPSMIGRNEVEQIEYFDDEMIQ